MFELAESFTKSKKGSAEANEDFLIDGANWLVICDGATSKSKQLRSRETDGRILAREVAMAIAGAAAGISAQELTNLATAAHLRLAAKKDQNQHSDKSPLGVFNPMCVFIAVDKVSGTVVRVGDLHWLDGFEVHLGTKKIDEINSSFRSAHLRILLAAGFNQYTLGLTDYGRDLILPSLTAQYVLCNNTGVGDLGYGAIDGQKVPEKFVESWTLSPDVKEVVVCLIGRS